MASTGNCEHSERLVQVISNSASLFFVLDGVGEGGRAASVLPGVSRLAVQWARRAA